MASNRTTCPHLLVVAIVASVLGPAASVWAHPDVDAGRERYAQADFPGALEAFARAEAADDLTSDELLDLLERRMLVHLVLGDQAAADRDLASIRSLDPEHEFAADVPPEVVEAFGESGSATLALVVESEPASNGVEIAARVENDPSELAREIRVHYRVDGGPWERSTDARTDVAASAGSTVDVYAEAIGPGGVLIASVASADEPREINVAGELTAVVEDDDDAATGFPWLWVGVGGAAAVAVAVTVAILASGGDGSTETHPFYPMIEF